MQTKPLSATFPNASHTNGHDSAILDNTPVIRPGFHDNQNTHKLIMAKEMKNEIKWFYSDI